MQINIVAVGKRQADWVDKGVNEYIKRFPPELKVQLHQVAAVKRNRNNSRENITRQEAERISSHIPTNHRLVVLDEKGKPLDTLALSGKIESWMQQGINASFVIGGADGVDESLRQQADELLSLSAFTFPHGLARIVLVEQLYRAWSVLRNHPYHRQ